MKLRVVKDSYHSFLNGPKELNRDWWAINLNCGSDRTYKFNFPYLIQIQLIIALFYALLRDRDFSGAFQLLLLNKAYTRYLYNLIYEPTPHNPYTMIKRMGITLSLCTIFDDSYLTELNLTDKVYSINLRSRNMNWDGTYKSDFWELLPCITVSPLLNGYIMDDTEGSLHTFQTGPFKGDTVMAIGTFDGTILETNQLQQPLFILQITDSTGIPMFNEYDPIPFSYKCISKLLTYVYGPNTTVYLASSPDIDGNPFYTTFNKLTRL